MASKVGVLLLHGLTGVPSEMRPVEKYLQKMGFELETPTLAGHGGTNDELLNSTWEQWLASAQQGYDRLAARTDEVVVCGLSMGGLLSSILASKDNVRALILMSPTITYDSPELDKPHLRIFKSELFRDFLHIVVAIFPVIGRSMYWTECPPYGLRDERLQRQITKAIEAAKNGKDTKFGLFRTYWVSMWHMTQISKMFRRTAHSVTCPTLIISSLEDSLVSINNATNSYSLVSSKDRSLSMLTGCDHVLTLDLKRNYVCRLVGEFMEALTGIAPPEGVTANVDLTLDVHNRLNPLGSHDWARLVPGSPALAGFADSLQKQGVHESSCHTIVVRNNNVPILMLPLVIDQTNKTAQVGIAVESWDKAPAAGGDSQLIAQSWQQCNRVLKALCKSFGIKQIKYLEQAAKTIAVA